MKCQILFSGKSKKNFIKLSSAEFAQSCKDTFKGGNSVKNIFVSQGEQILSFQSIPASEWDWCAQEQTGNHKSCLPCKKMVENLPCVSCP